MRKSIFNPSIVKWKKQVLFANETSFSNQIETYRLYIHAVLEMLFIALGGQKF